MSVVVFSHGIHRMLGCVIGGVGMAGMPYPPNLCTSVQSVGGTSLPECSVCSAYSVGHSLPVCLVMSVVVFSHGIHGMLGCVIGGVGMAGMPYPPNLCASVPICGRHFSARRFCVFRVFCGALSVCFVGASVGGTSPLVSVRHPIRLRPPPDQIAFATQSDCVRRPIRLRPPPDQIASAIRSDSVRHPIRLRPLHDAISSVCILRRLRCNTQCVYVLPPFMFAKLRNKFDF